MLHHGPWWPTLSGAVMHYHHIAGIIFRSMPIWLHKFTMRFDMEQNTLILFINYSHEMQARCHFLFILIFSINSKYQSKNCPLNLCKTSFRTSNLYMHPHKFYHWLADKRGENNQHFVTKIFQGISTFNNPKLYFNHKPSYILRCNKWNFLVILRQVYYDRKSKLWVWHS